MRAYPYRDYGYHYSQRYYYQQPLPPSYVPNQYPAVSPVPESYGHIPCHSGQGYYYQPLYHCPTCGAPVYVVYVPAPQAAKPPSGFGVLLVAILVLLAVDIVFLRR